jgi:hypothetical protein
MAAIGQFDPVAEDVVQERTTWRGVGIFGQRSLQCSIQSVPEVVCLFRKGGRSLGPGQLGAAHLHTRLEDGQRPVDLLVGHSLFAQLSDQSTGPAHQGVEVPLRSRCQEGLLGRAQELLQVGAYLCPGVRLGGLVVQGRHSTTTCALGRRVVVATLDAGPIQLGLQLLRHRRCLARRQGR